MFVYYAASTAVIYLSTLYLLSVHSNHVEVQGKGALSGIDAWIARLGGVISAAFVLYTPYIWEPQDALAACGLRVIHFFAACKILDVAVARAGNPPKLLSRSATGKESKGNSIKSKQHGFTTSDHVRYVWSILTEMRYHSFDIQPRQKNRQPYSAAWKWGPIVVIPLATYLVPIMQMKCLLLLLVIRYGLEIGHSIVHPSCGDPFFWYPFAASSMSRFWAIHWHSCAEPFLRTLAYDPVYHTLTQLGMPKTAAKAAGAIAGFSLSGIWHGWAAAALSTNPYELGFRVWTLFTGMGVICILENYVWSKEQQGNILQRIFVWAYALSHAAWCWNALQDSCKVPWLAEL